MRLKLTPLALALCVTSFVMSPTFAADADSAQIQKLESEVNTLQQELIALKKELHSKKSGSVSPNHHQAKSQMSGNELNDPHNVPANSSVSDDTTTDDTQRKLKRSELMKMIHEEREYLPFDLDVPGQAFVSTGPYVGVPIQFSGSELVINSPSVNTDVQLLTIRKSILKQLGAMGGEISKEPYHSHLLLSGLAEAQANYTNHNGTNNAGIPVSDIDMSTVALDAFFLGPSEWTLGFIEFQYEDNRPVAVQQSSGVFINKAFITIGDLALSPFYGTVGQFYVPFGTYSSVMVSSPFTQQLARTKAKSILVGYQNQEQNALYAALYAFRGDSHAEANTQVNNGGINLGYRFEHDVFSGNIGGGLIANLADSTGEQTGNNFQDYEQIVHRVPAYNLRGLFNIGDNWNFIAEYVAATKAFSPNDMSYNGHGAKPNAFDGEIAYSLDIFERPSSVGVGYTHSYEALGLNIPQSRYSVVFNTSIWRNTLQSLEIRHDIEYPESATANGPVGAETSPGDCTASLCSPVGRSDNAITAQFDYYF